MEGYRRKRLRTFVHSRTKSTQWEKINVKFQYLLETQLSSTRTNRYTYKEVLFSFLQPQWYWQPNTLSRCIVWEGWSKRGYGERRALPWEPRERGYVRTGQSRPGGVCGSDLSCTVVHCTGGTPRNGNTPQRTQKPGKVIQGQQRRRRAVVQPVSVAAWH